MYQIAGSARVLDEHASKSRAGYLNFIKSYRPATMSSRKMQDHSEDKVATLRNSR